ncbi:hypothetical protein ACHAXA_008391 [Cyclostephanos tholiformis]|uniref:Uncharacterized protein n=1 Tax=Cyclostephanos tholiformis TaxID=382380 RepID=A0ABD3RVR8_9STRA
MLRKPVSTIALTRTPTSSPTSSRPVPPAPPVSGDMPVSTGGCSRDSDCPKGAPYCMMKEGENVCTACRNSDSDCVTSADGLYCVAAYTQSGFACAACRSGTCPEGQSCGIPSCLPDMVQYCSANHDAEDCGYMIPTTAAPARPPTQTTRRPTNTPTSSS